jgi:Flp pilus assembly protein TadG
LPPSAAAPWGAACADLRRPIGAFRADRAGNVTLIFTIAVVPPAGAVAAARDAITLMMSREAPDLRNGLVEQI